MGLCCCTLPFSRCGEQWRGWRLLFFVVCRLIAVASLVGRVGSGVWSVQAQQLWPKGLVALRHVGSSQTRDQTCVPCIGRWILNHWMTREVLQWSFCMYHNKLCTRESGISRFREWSTDGLYKRGDALVEAWKERLDTSQQLEHFRESIGKGTEMRTSVKFWQLPVVHCGWKVMSREGQETCLESQAGYQVMKHLVLHAKEYVILF